MSRGYSVLVADGDRDCADTLAIFFNRHGLAARCAYDGREAIGMARRMRPTSVIMEVEMPVVSGLDVARELRTTFRAAIRLVAYTGRKSERERIVEAGFDELVPKPAEIMDLLHAMSPQLRDTVMRSISVNVRQIRSQLALADSLAGQIRFASDNHRRVHDFVRSKVEGVVASMRRLPMPASDRRVLDAEVQAIRKRLRDIANAAG